ncbi:hypothetical protein GH714_031928 [Hevea brasiliensis]|uniref:non-specific serine/threonine protein kinase n=1 Tax=Hevea brasiliensis TaxID=3981 RepID=A0A6A6N415_HEVBR|nr:hypothetical protein GH714_031928 [Hevea brasiliensis]
MAFYNIASSINLTILATIIFFYTASNASTSVANVTSQPSSLQLEGKALLDSGWWKSCSNISSLHRKWPNIYCDVIINSRSYCNWPGITCNSAGSVTEIYPPSHLNIGNKFRKLNFSCFPNLTRLDLKGHGIYEEIPPQLGDLTKLRVLDLSSNYIHGAIPPEIGNMSCLQNLDVSDNILNGLIPKELGQLKDLVTLDLSDNKLIGSFPPTLGLLTNLTQLYMQHNQFVGAIPPEIGNMSSLQNLDELTLSQNQINESIPLGLGNLKILVRRSNTRRTMQLTCIECLYLANNTVSGTMPIEIGGLIRINELDLSQNKLEGPIPPHIGNLTMLYTLNLSHNLISGEIPYEAGFLQHLTLDLSYNKLTGTIPNFIASFNQINFSFNNFTGPIPCNLGRRLPIDSFVGNKGLYVDEINNVCFSPPASIGSANSNKWMHYSKIFLPITLFLAFLIPGSLFLYRRHKIKNSQTETKESRNGDVFSVWNYDGRIAFEDVIEATENFDIRCCIGTGGYGSVYKAQLPSGRVIALKKLHRMEAEEPSFDKCFKNESTHNEPESLDLFHLTNNTNKIGEYRLTPKSKLIRD